MSDSLQPTFSFYLLNAMLPRASGTIWRIARLHGDVTIREGTHGELREWEGIHGGGFRKYSLCASDWGKENELKFLPLERAYNIAFFVVVGVGEIKILPPRHLCV